MSMFCGSKTQLFVKEEFTQTESSSFFSVA